MDGGTALLAAIRIVVLFLGLSIAFLSYRAYRRTESKYLGHAAIGFTIVSLGVFVEGVLYEFLDWGIVTVHIVESSLVAIGFAVLLYSLLE